MNPLEIHKHVAQSSGREVADVSPLAAELTALASEASAVAAGRPDVVSEFEQGIKPEREVSGDVEEVMDHALGRAREYIELYATDDAPSTRIYAMAEMLALEGWDRDVYETAVATIHGSSSSPYKAGYYAALAIALPQLSLDALTRQAAGELTVPRERYSAYMSVWSLTGEADDLKEALFAASEVDNLYDRASAYVDIATKTGELAAIERATAELSDLPVGYEQLIQRAKLLKVTYSDPEYLAICRVAEELFSGIGQLGLDEIYQALVESMVGNVEPQVINNTGLAHKVQDSHIRNTIYACMAAAFAENGQEGKAHGTVSRISVGVDRCDAALEVAMVTRSTDAIDRVKNMVDFMSEDNFVAMSDKAKVMIGLAELTGDVNYLRNALELIDSCEADLGVHVLPRYMAVAATADSLIQGEYSEKIKRINEL